jgi:hypothetical protein
VPDGDAGASSTTGGSSLLVARVKTSTSTPRRGEPLAGLDDVDVHAARRRPCRAARAVRCARTGRRRARGGPRSGA